MGFECWARAVPQKSPLTASFKSRRRWSDNFGMALSDFFDGERWDRQSVVSRQRHWATDRNSKYGWELSESQLLSSPLTDDHVERFEETFNVRLPSEYRSFLLQVGDGGTGPGLYMRRLGAPFEDSRPWEPGEVSVAADEPNMFLSQEFPHSDMWFCEPRPVEFGEWIGTIQGSLFLFDYGCAMWANLVVTGSQAGEMWLERSVDQKGFGPARHADGSRANFASFYCSWLEHGSWDESG